MVKVKFRVRINGEWVIKEAVADSAESVKELCRNDDNVADWEIISTEDITK